MQVIYIIMLTYVCSCRLFQPDQCYLWCRIRILHRRKLSHNEWRCQVR